MASLDDVIHQRPDDHSTVNDNAPVHARCIRARRRWKESEHKEHHKQSLRHNVHEYPPLSQAELGRGQRIFRQPPPGDAPDGHDVAGHQSRHAQRKNRVQRDGGTDVDERKQGGRDEGHVDGVGGDFPADLGEPGTKGHAFVAGESV